MARKYDDNVVWVPLNADGWDTATKGIYAELRASWEISKEIKVRLETALTAKASKEASTWPAKAKAETGDTTPYTDMMKALQVGSDGKVAGTHVLKFSYMRGVAMASVPKPKAKGATGLVI